MKKISLLLISLLFVLVLAACGESTDADSGDKEEPTQTSSGSNNSEEPVEEPEEKIELTYWYAYGDKIGEANEKLVEQFNASQDKIHVTAEFQGNYNDLHAKTQAAFAAGNAPHVTLNEISSIEVFAESGMTQDLTEFAENDPDINMEDFIPGLMGNSYVNDRLYALPYLRSTPLLYMNKTMMEEIGLDMEGPKTWDDFVEFAEIIKNSGEDRIGMTMPVLIWYFEAFVMQAGGEMLNEDGTEVLFNSEAGVEALDLWRDMVKAGQLKIPAGADAGSVSYQDFANGKTGMVYSSTANLGNFLTIAEDNGFELTVYPFASHKRAAVTTGGSNLVMISGLDEKHQQAAWEFIKFMTAPEQTTFASEYTGYLPVRISAQESEAMQNLYEENPLFKVAVDQLEDAYGRPMVEAYPEIQKILTDEITRAILDENISSQEALDQAAEKANALLK